MSRPHRTVFDDAGGLAAGIVFDDTTRRIRRVAVNARSFQSRAVRHSEVPAYVNQIHRHVGGDGIQIVFVQIAVVHELGIVPAATADPLSGGGSTGVFRHRRLDLGNGVHRRVAGVDLSADEALGPVERVGVDIDETRQHRASLQVDFPGVVTCAGSDALVGPGSFDAAVAHRQCGHRPALAIHRDDVAVA